MGKVKLLDQEENSNFEGWVEEYYQTLWYRYNNKDENGWVDFIKKECGELNESEMVIDALIDMAKNNYGQKGK